MSGFSEEALGKLNKDRLTVTIQEQEVKHDRHEGHIENLVAEVRKVTSNFAKLESEPAIFKNIKTALTKRLLQPMLSTVSCRDTFIS